jgi:hypothetical protein
MYDSKGKQSKILLQSTKDIKPSFHVIIESVVSLSLSLSRLSCFFFSLFIAFCGFICQQDNPEMSDKKKTRTEKQKNPETERSFSSLSSFLAISKNSIFNARITQYPRFL